MPSIVEHSINSASEKPVFPGQVIVLGGGRWARVIASVLCDFLPRHIPITMCSPRGYSALLEWKARAYPEGRVSVLDQLPHEFIADSAAVIVANAASDHASAGRWALARKAAVLIEKPFGICSAEVLGLSDYAKKYGGLLAAAHVLRFNRYLRNFAAALPRFENILSIQVEWIDPAGESRHGESKKYDPAVSVYVDCLPHIVSILQSVFDLLPDFDKSPTVTDAGSRILLPLSLGGLPCGVLLQRNGIERVRRITVESTFGTSILDFSVEPGTITLGTEQRCADPSWDTAPRPLLSMLRTFLTSSMAGTLDSRFSLDTALTAASISEQVTPAYEASVVPWLVKSLQSTQELDGGGWYALSEVLRMDLKQVAWRENSTHALDLLRERLRSPPTCAESPQLMAEYIRDVFRHDIVPFVK